MGSALTDAWTYFWNFGDGTGATTTTSTLNNNQTHTYSLAGLYTVLLTLIDSASNSSTFTSSVQVTTPAQAPSNGASGGGSYITISGGGYFVTANNQPVTLPTTIVTSPIVVASLANENKATSTVATSAKSQVKNKTTVAKKKVTPKKPIAVKKVTTVVKTTEQPTFWNKVVSFIKKFGFGN